MIHFKSAIKMGCVCSIFVFLVAETGYSENDVNTSEIEKQIQISKEKWDSMSPEEQSEMKQRGQKRLDQWDNMSDEEKSKVKTRIKDRRMKNR
jgi:predicted Fe-S protein YdhL (DUF1289 family)